MIPRLLTLVSLAISSLAAPTPASRGAQHVASGNVDVQTASQSQTYIVSLKPNTVDPKARGEWLNTVLSTNNHTRRDLSSRAGSDLRLTWSEKIFNGIAGSFSEAEVETLSSLDEVKYIQPDLTLHTTATLTQTNAPWGLSRLSRTDSLPTGSNPVLLNFPYAFDDSGGSGVDIYILDTGVRTSHLDYTGRASFLATFGAGVQGQDLNGHGSHVSGTAGGSVFGVAKSASIIGIKCMDDNGAGATADIISAINLAGTTASSSGRPSVISMSLGGAANQAIDDAVINSVNLGVPFVVAAGNSAADASTSSPARLGGPGGNTGVITVGATTITDGFASFSNFGANVDVLAPGQDVLSCGIEKDDAVKTRSGTSMSTPHIAGLAALIMGQEGKLTPAALKQRIVSLASSGLISGVPALTANVLGNNAA